MQDLSRKGKKELISLYNQNRQSISTLDTKQHSLKIRLNSLYGALANVWFRWYDNRFAEGITKSGQLAAKTAATAVNNHLNKILETDKDYIIAVDTDSIYVDLAAMVKKCNPAKIPEFVDYYCAKTLQPKLNEAFEKLAKSLNCYENAMFMKREAIADRGVFVAKKRYMLNVINNEGVQYAEPDIKIMGLESVRSSTPQACRVSIKETIKLILQTDESTVQDFIANFRTEFNKLPFAAIAKNSSANGLEKYSSPTSIYTKGTPIHVRGSLLYNKLLRDRQLDKKHEIIFEGEKVKFVYLRMPNPIHQNVIAVPQTLPPELELDQYIDRQLQYDKTFLEPIKSILDIIGWTHEEINTLGDMWE